MKLAKDLMTERPLIINSGEDISTVIKIFVEGQITSAPVRSNTGEIMGMLTELGLIRAAIRNYINKGSEKSQIFYQQDLFLDVTSVNEFTPLDEVLKQLLQSQSHRVMVLNNAKAIVGIISPKDVLAYVFGEDIEFISLRKRIEMLENQTAELQSKLKSTKDIMEKYQKLFVDSPAMIHSVDKDGIIVMANRRIHKILGYEESELIGKKITEIYAKSCHADALQGLKTIQERGRHQNTYTTMVTKDGQKIRVDLVSSSLKDKDGKFISTITASRPIDSESLLRALHGAFKSTKIDEVDLEQLVTRLDNE